MAFAGAGWLVMRLRISTVLLLVVILALLCKLGTDHLKQRARLERLRAEGVKTLQEALKGPVRQGY